MRLLDRFRQWMVGRYGSDQLNIALLACYFICSVASTFFTSAGLVLMTLSYVFFGVIFYRMFSRNIGRRYEENQKFLRLISPIMNRIQSRRNYGSNAYQTRSFRQARKPKTDKNHKVFQCGKCGQMIRVPKGKGKIVITCPRCRQEFIKRT